MAGNCGPCNGTGSITEPMEYTEYDARTKTWKKRRGTKMVSCRACGGTGDK